MDENNQLVVYRPEQGEALQHYLERQNEVYFRQIITNENLSSRFANILLENFGELERLEDALENLWRILEGMNNLDYILSLLRRAETVRANLLDSFDGSIQKIQETCNTISFGRLVGSAVDFGGKIGSLLMEESNPAFAKYAPAVSLGSGIFGLLCSAFEIDTVYHILNDLMEKVEYDKETFAPIQRWYQQTADLNLAMQLVFPFDESNRMRGVLIEAGNKEIAPARILSALIRSVGEQDISRLRDARQILNLISLSVHREYQELYRWIWYRRHPVVLDTGRMLLQLHTSNRLRFLINNGSSVLSLAEQKASWLSWAHIGLDLMSISDNILFLRGVRNPPLLNEMRNFRQHFHSELVALRRIAAFIAMKRNERR